MLGSIDSPPIVIVTARWKYVLLLAMCVALAGLCFSVAWHGTQARLYLGAVFFGMAAPLMLWRILLPERLEISPNGLTWFTGRKTMTYGWREFAVFRAFRPSSRSLTKSFVGYDYVPDHPKRGKLTALNHVLVGLDGSFGGQWEISADKVASLLNEARLKWG